MDRMWIESFANYRDDEGSDISCKLQLQLVTYVYNNFSFVKKSLSYAVMTRWFDRVIAELTRYYRDYIETSKIIEMER